MTARIRLIETPGRIAAKLDCAHDQFREWWSWHGPEVRYFLDEAVCGIVLVLILAAFIFSVAC